VVRNGHQSGFFERTGQGGVTTDRAQWLAQVESGQMRYLSVRRCQTTIRLCHDTALVTGLVDIEVMTPSTGCEPEHNRSVFTPVKLARGGLQHIKQPRRPRASPAKTPREHANSDTHNAAMRQKEIVTQ
jgi:hypothetical protein